MNFLIFIFKSLFLNKSENLFEEPGFEPKIFGLQNFEKKESV